MDAKYKKKKYEAFLFEEGAGVVGFGREKPPSLR